MSSVYSIPFREIANPADTRCCCCCLVLLLLLLGVCCCCDCLCHPRRGCRLLLWLFGLICIVALVVADVCVYGCYVFK